MNYQEEVSKAADALRSGKVILYPTDTIWGLGCDASNSAAVKRIFEIKRRNDSKALITLISDINRLQDYVVKVPDIAWDIVEFAEKPLTVIYPKGKNVAQELLAEDGSIAIRVTKDKFCTDVMRLLRKPIVSTSANISGQDSPKSFSEINQEIINAADVVVDFRRDEKNDKASTIIKLELNGEIKFIRK